jgi:hypothetical protein
MIISGGRNRRDMVGVRTRQLRTLHAPRIAITEAIFSRLLACATPEQDDFHGLNQDQQIKQIKQQTVVLDVSYFSFSVTSAFEVPQG